MSNVQWFSNRNAQLLDCEPIKLTFMERPRGIKINASGAKHMNEMRVKYVTLGVEKGTTFLVRPTTESEYMVHPSQDEPVTISSVPIYEWAQKNGLLGRTLEGFWHGRRRMYVFDLREGRGG